MAKVKSVKFYNFTGNLSSNATPGVGFIVKFYDIENKLIKIDFKNLITNTTTYCEDPEYIVTASKSYDNYGNCAFQSYDFKNFNKNVENVNCFFWISGTDRNITSDWNKIEFKYPTYISKIKILHTMHSKRGFTSCDIEVEYEDGIIEVYNYVSNGQTLPYTATQMENLSWDQDILDSWFDSIEFSKSKQIYDSEIGLIETLETNQFRNIPVNSVEDLKTLYFKPEGTNINCIISFDQKQTWKSFDGNNWIEINDISSENIILNCMSISMLNNLNKNKLITGGFTGDLDFKIAMKTNDINKTPSVSKIYIEYK